MYILTALRAHLLPIAYFCSNLACLDFIIIRKLLGHIRFTLKRQKIFRAPRETGPYNKILHLSIPENFAASVTDQGERDSEIIDKVKFFALRAKS